MTECTRCGRCCHVVIDGKVIKCRHLVKLPSGKTLCRNYKNRLGTIIAVDEKNNQIYRCNMRSEGKNDWKDCPFNDGKPLYEVGY